MQSRMERYSKSSTRSERSRSAMNQDLYKTIYNMGEYSNIEGVATIGKTNEIDITKIKELLKSREDYQKEKEFRNIMRQEPEVLPEVVKEPEEEKNYDIRDILSKAKSERTESDEKYYKLKNENYSFLKNQELKQKMEEEEPAENLEGLIHTITNTSLLNKLGDRELSLNLLDDLKSSGNTVVTSADSIQSVLREEKNKTNNTKEDDSIELDKSFYTSSMNFNTGDFEDLKDITKTIKKDNRWIKTLLIVLIVAILITVGVFVFLTLK